MDADRGQRTLAYRLPLFVIGLSCFAALVFVLVATADTTPTNYTSTRFLGLWRGRSIGISTVLAALVMGIVLAYWSHSHLLAYLSIIVATAGSVGALEILGASGLVDWKRLFNPPIDQLEALGAKRVPNLDVRGTTFQDTAKIWSLPTNPMPFHYRTDRYGFRNHLDRVTTDLIIVGDSIVVGALVPAEKTVNAVLERLSGKTVMQAALIGLAPQEQHQAFWEARLDVRGRHIVQFVFEGNDLLDSYILRTKNAKTIPRPNGRSTLVYEIWRKLLAATSPRGGTHGLRVCTIGGQLYTFLWGRQSFQGLEGEIPIVLAALEQFASRIRSAGGRYSVVFVPTKLHVLAELCTFPESGEIKDPAHFIGSLRNEISAWSKRSGIALLDLTPPLIKGAREGRIPWFWGDSHWNEVGHEIAAQALSQWHEVRLAQ